MNANLGSNKQSTRLEFTGIFHESDAIHLSSQSCNHFTRSVQIVNNISEILSLIKNLASQGKCHIVMSKILYLKDDNFHSFYLYNGQLFKMKILSRFDQTGEFNLLIL